MSFEERFAKAKASELGFWEVQKGLAVMHKHNPVYPGAKLFQLKATHGVPLENSLDMLMNQKGLRIDWEGFIDEARKNEWWDYQTLEAVEHGLVEATIEREAIGNILTGLKLYVMSVRHPMMGSV